MSAIFADQLQDLLKQKNFSIDKVAKLSGVAKETVRSWIRRGSSPRYAEDVLRVAQTIGIDQHEVDNLLKGAQFSSLEQLKELAERDRNSELLKLLAIWEQAPSQLSAVPRETRGPFQVEAPNTEFIGRKSELRWLREELLSGGKICVLLGMGGIGKSALAAHVAKQLRREFPDGVLWARLRDVESPEETLEERLLPVLGRFAEAYHRDISEYSDLESRASIVRELLAYKRALVVLDNVQSSQELTYLLPNSKSCSVLITTRTAQAVAGHKDILPISALSNEESLDLLISLIGEARAHDEVEGAKKIIDLVGGHALALSIIGRTLAVTDYLTLVEYATDLQEMAYSPGIFSELEDWQDTSRNVLASFELSYRRLPSPVQQLFAQLCLFDGDDFSIEAIAALAQLSVTQTKKMMGRLHSVSLIESIRPNLQEKSESKNTNNFQTLLDRYRLHSLLKAFARYKLPIDVNSNKEPIAQYFLTLTHRFRTESYLLFDLEWDNLRGVIEWAINLKRVDMVLEAVTNLTYIYLGAVGFVDARGYWRQVGNWISWILEQPELVQTPLDMAWLEVKLGFADLRLTSLIDAEQHFQRALHLLETVGFADKSAHCKAYACDGLSQLAMSSNKQEALNWAEQGLSALTEIEAQKDNVEQAYFMIRLATMQAQVADLLNANKLLMDALTLLPQEPTSARISGLLTLGNIHDMLGESDKAKSSWLTGVAAAQQIGDNRRLAHLWRNLAIQAEEQGNFDECEKYNRDAFQLYQQIGDRAGEGSIASNLAVNYLRQDKSNLAWPYIQQALQIADEHQLADLALYAKINFAHYHLQLEQFTEASKLLEECLSQSEEVDATESLAEIYRLQAQVARQQADYGIALRLIDQSIQVADENALEAGASWRVKAEILGALHYSTDAITAFNRSLALFSDHPYELAKTQTELDRHQSKFGKHRSERQFRDTVIKQTDTVFEKTLSIATAGRFTDGVPTQQSTKDGMETPPPKDIKETILFLAADPTDMARLRLGKELHEIDEQLALSKYREHFTLQQSMAVRAQDVTSAILKNEPTIVHFSGHGINNGELCFEDEAGKAKPVPINALADLFRLVSSHVNCVVLNACYSIEQAQAIARHIRYVIGVDHQLSDSGALAFTLGFYQALGAGKSIPDAFDFGRVQISLQGSNEDVMLVLVQSGE